MKDYFILKEINDNINSTTIDKTFDGFYFYDDKKMLFKCSGCKNPNKCDGCRNRKNKNGEKLYGMPIRIVGKRIIGDKIYHCFYFSLSKISTKNTTLKIKELYNAEGVYGTTNKKDYLIICKRFWKVFIKEFWKNNINNISVIFAIISAIFAIISSIFGIIGVITN